MKVVATTDDIEFDEEETIMSIDVTWRNLLNKALEFIIDVKNKVVEYLNSIWANVETIVVLGLASFELTHLLNFLPYWSMLPAWISPALFVPALSVSIISFLLWSNQQRNGYEDVE